MKIAIVGAGAVGGYYGALMSRVGADVSFVARGAHRDAIRANGLRIIGVQGDFTVKVAAEDDPARIGPVDVVIIAVKTYDNDTAFPIAKALMGEATTVLTLQNGVDSAEDLARVIGKAAVIAGPTYIATAIDAPGVIRQTGTHRRIVFGEVFDPPAEVTPRVRALADLMLAADIHAEPVADARIPLWEKFIYLAPFAAFTGAARSPIGPLWSDEETRAAFLDAVREVEKVARASGINVAPQMVDRIAPYTAGIPASTRSSLLIDLSIGKRIEVESLPGSVVRRGRAVGVETPLMRALYAVLKPWTKGPIAGATATEVQLALMIVLFTFLAGIGAGTFGALLGIGGGIFLVPFLNIALDIPMEQAMAISLITVIATSNFVSQASTGRRFSNVRLAMVLQLVAAVGAIAGTHILGYISQRTREQIFGGTALLVAAVMISKLNQRNILPGDLKDVGMLGGWVPDPDTGELAAYRLKRLPLAMSVAGGAGVISTLTGIGGGVLVVPALNSWCGIPMRVAAATSSVILGVTAIPGVVDNFANGRLTRPVLAASAVLGVIAGSRAGFWIGAKVTVRSLKILMAVVLSIVAIEYLWFR